MMKNRTTIIIVTYNGIKWIDECIQSLLDNTLKVSIIVVDNNSSDNTVSFIKEKYNEDVFLIESKENLGFGKGNNLGLSYALKKGADYVFLLNQDAYIEKDTLEKLVEVANNNPEFGIISPIHLNAEGTALEAYFADFTSLKYSKSFYPDHVINRKVKDIYPVRFINAAAWLIPKNILKEIGGFDPIFWHYGEDDNYCQRVLFHNYKIGVVSGAFIRHDSNIRKIDCDYFFSEQYYQDFTKVLQKKYGNLNYNFTVDILKYEKKKVLKQVIECIFKFKLKDVPGHFKKISILNKIIPEILKSRMINKVKEANYIT